MRARGALLAAVAAVAAGCGAPAIPGAGRPAAHGTVDARLTGFTSFGSCSQLLDVVRGRALDQVGPWGEAGTGAVAGPGVGGPLRDAATMAPSAPSAGAAAAGGSASPDPSGTPSFSTTNDQEQGVDEPDLAKTDGRLLVTLRQNPVGVQVTSVSPAPALRGFLALSQMNNVTGLFLVGNDAVVIGSTAISPPVPQPAPLPSSASVPGSSVASPVMAASPTTEVAVVDVSDPDHPSLVRSFDITGSEVDARLINGTVEVVVQSSPRLGWVTPADGSASSQAAATADNRSIVEQAGPSAWLPTVTDSTTGATTTPACDKAYYSSSSTGDDTVSVVPIDPNSDHLGPTVTAVGDASTVYASTTGLYVADDVYGTPAADGTSTQTTQIAAFDLSDPANPHYVASGSVPGALIGQYALSEYQGYLRVATTVGEPSPAPVDGGAPVVLSDNRVTVLQAQNGTLSPVGTVSGLGAGEKLYAVRFIGSLGYVVTFQQTDPLYVLDLHDPAHPSLAGQLPLTGYSSFLEPLSDGQLLGIGQSVDSNYRTAGLQLSLFDVSDPAHPALESKQIYANSSSTAESDPHALLWWPGAQEAVLPVSGSSFSASGSYLSGALVMSVVGNVLTEVATIDPPVSVPDNTSGGGVAEPPVAGLGTVSSASPGTGGVIFAPVDGPVGGGVTRDLVIGSDLFSVTDGGILVSDMGSFHQLAWLAYPANG